MSITFYSKIVKYLFNSKIQLQNWEEVQAELEAKLARLTQSASNSQ